MEVREMVAHMVDVAGLDFPDLTGHNVMVDEAGQAAWIIDFEHAQPVGGRAECCDFIQEFLDGRDGWNVDFA
jgi:RIO-like serine/threonine protein kinase